MRCKGGKRGRENLSNSFLSSKIFLIGLRLISCCHLHPSLRGCLWRIHTRSTNNPGFKRPEICEGFEARDVTIGAKFVLLESLRAISSLQR